METILAVEAYLKTLPELDGIGVVAEVEQDFEKAMQDHLAKSKGYAVIIGELPNKNSDTDMKGPRVSFDFGVSVYSPKHVRDGQPKGYALRDAIMRGLHQEKLMQQARIYDEVVYKNGRILIEKNQQNVSTRIHAMVFKTVAQY
ncbi:MAG: hypothetical protein ACSHX2_14110 [Rubritalea sp.]